MKKQPKAISKCEKCEKPIFMESAKIIWRESKWRLKPLCQECFDKIQKEEDGN